MLKHSLDRHGDDIMNDKRFMIKVLKYTRSPFERQVRESVYLQQFGKDHILNSKSEYNRCSIPRLSTMLGEREVKEGIEKEEIEKRKEMEILRKIRMLRKERNRDRRDREDQKEEKEKPKALDKKRKLNKQETKVWEK